MSKKRWKNYLILACAIALILLGVFFIWASNLKIPNLDSFADRQVVQSTKIYDRTGQVLLYDANQNEKRTVVPFDQISQNMKDAVVAIEDKDFYKHSGVEFSAIIRALLTDIEHLSFSQGGSTITQQVIKNSLLTDQKAISRKIKEFFLADKLEKVMTKDEILDTYLNEIPFGGALYGVEEASQTFFGVHATDLDTAQSAYLAALIQAPSYYSPYGSHVDELNNRKNLVLKQMLANGYISQAQYASSTAEAVVFKPEEEKSIKAPHFVFYVLNQLENTYGEDMVENGGLKVTTTLDYTMEEEGEAIASSSAASNTVHFNASNAAFVAIDPKTGQILAMVGSRDYFDPTINGNFNIATALRQPGSTFKPFVYATAFNKGYTPNTVLFDVPTQFQTNCPPSTLTSLNGCYAPVDYDGQYRGPITLRNALAQSINIPSVEVLYLAGIKDSITTATSMGITTLGNADQYGLTLVLGGGEVRLLDMVSAYGGFATEGIHHAPNSILEVDDKDGNVLEQYKDSSTTVLPPETARMISNILSDNVAREPAYGETSALSFPNQDVAVKTGTTNDYRDAWIVGYTPNIVLGAWAGNNDNTPMVKKVAGLIVAPMWRQFMDTILPTRPVESFTPPPTEDSFDLKPVLRGEWQGGISHLIDTVSGQLATPNTPISTTKEVLSGGIHNILYWLNKDDPRGPAPTDPHNDPQFASWEYALDAWLAQKGIPQPPDPVLPSGVDTIHTAANKPSISITNPKPDASLPLSSPVTITTTYNAHTAIKEVDLYVNDSLVQTNTTPPYTFTFTPSALPYATEDSTIKVEITDTNGSTATDELSLHFSQ